MAHYRFSRIALVVCVLMSFSGFTMAAMVECIDETGAVTFTDQPCKVAEDANRAEDAAGSRKTKPRKLAVVQPISLEEHERTVTWANRTIPARGLASDVAMMKDAKAAMEALDRASVLERQQILARR